MSTDPLHNAFLGGDPIAGQEALIELIERGDAGEASLFSMAIRIPTVQVRRRWLQYVATRPRTIGPRLFDRVRGVSSFDDGYLAAALLAGLPLEDPTHQCISEVFHADFVNGCPDVNIAQDYHRISATMYALASVDFTPWSLWDKLSDSSYGWEKLGTHAFRTACTVAARFGSEHLSLVERFVTGEAKSNFVRERSIGNQELWLQAFYTFPLWRAGSLLDEIIKVWSEHKNANLRHFGAMILKALDFRRAQDLLLVWIAKESEESVRSTLITALANCGTRTAADAVMEFSGAQGSCDEALASVARHATDQSAAAERLELVASRGGSSAAEALVTLARMGVASRGLSDALFSDDSCRRLNAALAYGILADRSRLNDLVTMEREASEPMESVYISAALAMLGVGGETLYRPLCVFASKFDRGGEPYYLKRSLKEAIVTAFERGGSKDARFLKAWKAEFEPLSTVYKPLIQHEAGVRSTVQNTIVRENRLSHSFAEPTTEDRYIAARRVPEQFKVAFSFAGAQRAQVTAVAEALEQRLGRGLVFLDDWFQAYLAGNDADLLLQRIYGMQSVLVVMCIGDAYNDRPWTIVEHRAIRALAWGAKVGSRQAMRVFPLRFDDGNFEGVLENTIAPDVRNQTPNEVAELILERLHIVDQ